ncbi:hypothetical protein D9611_008134 [Ephemerocybe angulata]|uniref:Uncharacterized protein n=1 Tax=Ephemerocybe angulata TaxID=980116 RepID=A0A8H5FD80_9AGAR|nr:hypothetical protein D9611_008134 [Tulosesus angulatus]
MTDDDNPGLEYEAGKRAGYSFRYLKSSIERWQDHKTHSPFAEIAPLSAVFAGFDGYGLGDQSQSPEIKPDVQNAQGGSLGGRQRRRNPHDAYTQETATRLRRNAHRLPNSGRLRARRAWQRGLGKRVWYALERASER